MDFNHLHPKLSRWIPVDISIENKEYEIRSRTCNKCENNFLKYNDVHYKHKLGTDIFFEIYYWFKIDSLGNKYAYANSKFDLMHYFNCNSEEEVREQVKQIGIYDLVELGTYHALWIHYDFHDMGKESRGIEVKKWDPMYQSKHVEAKNLINYMIYLLVHDPLRKRLMQEIRDFSMCPPLYTNAVSGFEYKQTKLEWEKKVSGL